MADEGNNFGIQVTVDASGSTDGARVYQRSVDDIAKSAKQAAEGAKTLNTELKNMGGSDVKEALEGIKGSLEGLNTALKALGIGAVVVEFRELFEIGKQLEDGFIHLQIVSGQTGESLEQLKESTVSLSNSFGQSQIKVVAAQIQAAKAGFEDLNDNTKVTAASLELAKIGFTDAGTAAHTLTEVMQAYGATAEDARSISQSLFIAVNKGNLDLNQLGAVFERIAPSAQAAGLSINQVLATLRALGTVESPQRAMLGITQLLKDISQPAPEVQLAFDKISDSLKKAGVQAATFKELVTQQGFIGALKSINEVAGGSSEQLGKALGNPQAGITAYALVNQAAKAYANTLDELSDKERAAAAASDEITKSTAFQAEQFRERVQNSFIGLAGKILESLTPAFKFLNNNFDGITVAAEILATLLATRLAVSAVTSAIAFVQLRFAAAAAAIAEGEVATASAAAAVGMGGMGVAAATASVTETAAAVATDALAVSIEAIGGPITILLGLLAAAALAWYHYGDSTQAALKDNEYLKADLERLSKAGAIKPDALTDDDAENLRKRKDTLEKQIASEEALKKQSSGNGALTTVDESGSITASVGFSTDDERKLVKDKETLDKLNRSLSDYNDLRNLVSTLQGTGGLENSSDFTNQAPPKAADTSAAELGKNAQLQQAYDRTFKSVRALTDATTALQLIQGKRIEKVGITPLDASGQVLAEQLLRAEIVASTDAQTKNQRALDNLKAKLDPVTAATNQFKNELKQLADQQFIVTGSHKLDADTLLKLNVAEQQSLTTANAKVQSNLAINDSQKAYINTVATQTNRILELNKALTTGRIAPEAYAAAIADTSLQLDKAVLSTQALASGQLRLAQATLALRAAQATVAISGGSDQDKAKFLAEAKVAQDDAARSSDTLALRVQGLAGQYEPLIAIQKKYADQLDEINSLQRARPDLAPALETTKTLIPLQAKQEADKQLSLPAADKSAILANDDYDLTIQKINNDLVANRINQNQANQAILEAKQALNAASEAYDDFAKAGIEAGKSVGNALQNFLIKPSEGLKGLLQDILKGLQAAAANALSKQIIGGGASLLANSGNETLSKLGTNLATGAGARLFAPKSPSLDTFGKSETSSLLADKGLDLGKQAAEASAPEFDFSKIGGDSPQLASEAAGAVGDIGSGASDLGSSTALTTAGTTLSASGAALSSAAAALSAAAAQMGSSGLGGDASSLLSSDDTSSYADDALSILGDSGYAAGGDPPAGKSVMVGETGPERVTFGAGAHVQPNDQVRVAVGAAAGNSKSTVVPAPQVNVPVQVVNVSDPDDVPNGMATAKGGQAIRNYISQNKSAVRSSLGV